MKGIKGTCLEFSDALTTAIELCFEQDTETLTDSYWDTLLAAEEVQECDKVGVDEESRGALACLASIAPYYCKTTKD